MSEITSTGRIEVGRVIQQLFAVLGRNFGPFLLLAVLLSGLPTAVSGFLQPGLAGTRNFAGAWQFGLAALVAGLAGIVLQGGLIHATVGDVNGRPASIGDSLTAGLNNLLPLMAIGLFTALGIAAGMILLVVPGFMFATTWAVVSPSYLCERRTGIFDSFGRSAQLTRGNRWRIFGLMVLFFLALILIQTVVFAIGRGSLALMGQAGPLLATRILTPVGNVFGALVGGTGVAVLYAELRKAKEGVGAEGLAAVFD